VPLRRRGGVLPAFRISPTLRVLPAIAGVLVAAPSARADGPSKSECAAANETAQDLRTSGKLQEARRKLAICTADTCPGPIREDCGQRLQELESAVPTIMFEAVDAVGHDLTSVRVVMDGHALAQQLGGTALEVDPGEHRFVFDSAGFQEASETFVIREGEHNRNLRVVLQAIASPSVGGPEGETQRWLGLGLGGAGAAGLIVGTIFGLVSKSTYDHAFHDECGGNANDCSVQGAKDGETAHSQAAIATVGFVAGAALLAAGAAFYFSAPHEGDVAVAASLSNGGGGLALRGRW
jgi:hypothetical protein